MNRANYEMPLNFIMTNAILSMQDSFTFSDAVQEIRKYIEDVNINFVKSTINRLRENDYLEEVGSYYRVLENDKSTRWGIF